MEPTIIVAIITAGGSLTSTIITAIKNKSLSQENKSLHDEKQNLSKDNKKLNDEKQKLETQVVEIKLISKGMMVGYYFSFIKRLFDSLERPEVNIKDEENKSVYKLSRENMRLEIIVPKTLNDSGLKEATVFRKGFRKGIIIRKDLTKENEEILFKEINYRIEEGSNNAFIVVDVPNPFETAVMYYKPSLYDTPNRQLLIERELINFEETINDLIVRTEELAGKISIRRL
jgi:hypothetical protein